MTARESLDIASLRSWEMAELAAIRRIDEVSGGADLFIIRSTSALALACLLRAGYLANRSVADVKSWAVSLDDPATLRAVEQLLVADTEALSAWRGFSLRAPEMRRAVIALVGRAL